MKYIYAPKGNFEDFASGRVIYSHPGQPAFPVRLASEIFQRALVLWRESGGTGRCTLYDPTCGGAFWLVVLAYLHWEEIDKIFASDLKIEGVVLAKRNLSLLTSSGLDGRIDEIKRMFVSYGKDSHSGALESAQRLREQLVNHLESHEIPSRVFQADVMDSQAPHQGLGTDNIDLILADVPYGWHTDWGGQEPDQGKKPIYRMLSAMASWLNPTSVIAIAADKSQRVHHPEYQRSAHFQVGKRRIIFLQLH